MGAKRLQTYSVDLQLVSNNYNAKLDQSRSKTRAYTKEAKAANDASYGLAGGFSTAANQAAVLYGPLNGVSGRLSAVASGLGSVGVAGFAGAAGLSAVVAIGAQGLSVFAEWERQQFRTQALLRSTGSASGLTANQIDQLSRSVALNTLGSVEGVNDATNVLLTFKTVQQDVFVKAIELSQDLAAVMGGDTKSAALQLGKALEDPTTGLTALKRSGVSFSESEKEVIKNLQETNRLADAQRLVLEKLEAQVGGAGGAEAQGLTGAMDTLGQRYDEFLFDLTETSRLGQLATSTVNTLAQGMRNVHQSIMPDDDVRLNEITARRMELRKELQEMGDYTQLPDMNLFGYSKSDFINAQRELHEISKEAREIQDRRIEEIKAQGKAQAAAEQARLQHQEEQEKAAEQRRLEQRQKVAKQEAERQARLMESQQQAGASKLAAMDMQFAGEQDKLRLQFEQRLAQLEQLKLSEAELERRGFESIEALQAEYRQRAQLQYQLDQEALALRKEEEAQRENERRLSEIEQIRVSMLTKEQAEREAYERRQEMLRNARNDGLIGEQRYHRLSEQSWEKHHKRLAQMEAQRNAATYANASNLFGGLADLTKAFGGEQSGLYKAMFAASKAFAVAESIIKIQQGIASAAALPFPANIPAMASVISATAGIVSTIQGTQLQGMAHSGMTSIPREGTWLLSGGERIVKPEQNRDLTNYLAQQRGGSQSGMVVNIHNYGNDQVRVEQSDSDQLDIYIEAAREAVAADVHQGGNGISDALESAYGVGRQARR